MKLVEMHFENSNYFRVCVIKEINDDYFISVQISPYGEYDGCIIQKTKDIGLIKNKTKYLSKINKIVGNVQDLTLSSYCDFLNCAFQNNRVVGILSNKEKVIKYYLVLNFLDEYVTLHNVSDYGEKKKIIEKKIADIKYIELDSLELKCIERLLKLNYE